MYSGNNPTALKSQRWLTEALINLMQEIPYEKITIQLICKKAYLSRQTFYNFFSSKEDVLRFWLQEKYEEQFSRFTTKPTMQDTIDAFIFVLNKNKQALTALADNKLDGIVADEMVKCVTKFAEKYVLQDKEMNDTLKCSIILLAGAFAHLLIYCAGQQKKISDCEISSLLKSFLLGELYEFGEDGAMEID
ncbi:MAG: TetR/AcrR family transcriptional regulator [Clostridia bacterium]|nr:TetR/AcrR family transcriptional regulator [Clostridia bacterium]